MVVSARAYSTLDIKSVNEDQRILTGLATTPSVDRMGDIVEPAGAEFELPIPFLWQHDSANPVGHVTKAKVTKAGIEVEIQMQRTDEPGLVKDRLDAAWQDIKLRLVRGLSIGFAPLETARIEGSYGMRFLRWLWLELSGVTVAANGDCSIATIKAIDHEVLANLPPTAAPAAPEPDTEIPAEPEVKAASGQSVHVVKLNTPARARAPYVLKKINHLR